MLLLHVRISSLMRTVALPPQAPAPEPEGQHPAPAAPCGGPAVTRAEDFSETLDHAVEVLATEVGQPWCV